MGTVLENSLTNREIAALVWLAVFFGWAMLRPSVRSSFRGVLRAAGHPAIIVSLVGLFSYVGLLVFFGYEFGVWTPNMTKHTLIWLLGPALVLVANMAGAWEEERFFRSTTKGTLAASAVLAVVVNFCILSLPAELVLQPVLALLVMAEVVAASRDEFRQVKRLIDFLLGLAGFALLACGLTRLVRGSMVEGISAAAGELLLPVALSVTLLPFVFALALYAAYESTFARVRIMTRNETSTWEAVRGRLAIIAACHFRVREVGRLNIAIARDAANADSFVEAWRAVRASRKA
jgi:hypothetical protein